MTLRNDILAAIRANPGHSQVELLEVCRLEHKGTLSKIVRRLERLEYVREQEGCYYPSNKTGFPDPVPVSPPPAPLSFGPDATPAEMLKENIPLALRKHREFLDLKLDIEDVRGARMQLDAATATMNVAVKLEDIGLRRHEVDIDVNAPSPWATPEQPEEQRRVAAAIGFNFTR